MVSNICDSFQILGIMDNERTPLLLANTKESYSSIEGENGPRPLIINVEFETESIEQVYRFEGMCLLTLQLMPGHGALQHRL